MASTLLKRLEQLPPISAVDQADNYLGLLLSDLDMMASDVDRLAGTSADLHDEVFLQQHGIALDDEARHVDPAIIARILVFADELEGDAETLHEYAVRLRASLLSIYRENIIEPRGRRWMRGGDDG